MPDSKKARKPAPAMNQALDAEALSEAQTMIYDAWDMPTARARVAQARKALRVSPLCADAYNLLAEEAKSDQEAREFYLLGLEAGAAALGPNGFAEYDGEFWGFLETRPYMRAREGLVRVLLSLGETREAIEHMRAMLKLNPNDNQGVRYTLLGALVEQDDIAGLKALFRTWSGDVSLWFLYTRALMAFREGRGEALETRNLVRRAIDSNEYVPGILAETNPRVVSRDGYMTVGGPEEATEYVDQFGPAWRNTPGAVAWLTGLVKAPASSKASSRET
jgi:tetratricopeptide (TPR) repeat protein